MNIKLYRSATIGINISGKKILCDPWLVDGEYFGSWSHYPYYDLEANLSEINSYDAIYVSHIHPDHCSEKTMKKIDKKIPVYIHNYHSKFLKFKIERMGFKVIELMNGKKNEIFKNVNLNIYAADNCNPELCYKFLGCADMRAKDQSQQIDTIAVFDDGKHTLVNLNDCPYELVTSTFKDINKNYEKIDILMTGYGGAGPYPQCFENLNVNEKVIHAKNKEKQFLNYALKFVDALKPRYFLPFAGTYTLTGKLSKLQNLRGVPDIHDAYDFFDTYFDQLNNIETKSIKLNPGSSFDLNAKECDQKYIKSNIDEYKNYISQILSKKLLDYESIDIPKSEEIFELAKRAHKNFLEKKILNKIKYDEDIYIKFNSHSVKINNKNYIDLIKNEEINKNSKYIIFELDSRLLKWLLNGPKYAHWNNAEIGSHIKYFRKPNTYSRNLHANMCYFHI